MDGDILQQYGGYGIAVALAGFVMYLMKEHRKERKEDRIEWANQLKNLFEKEEDMQKQTNEVLRDTTNILSGLKALFEVHLRK